LKDDKESVKRRKEIGMKNEKGRRDKFGTEKKVENEMDQCSLRQLGGEKGFQAIRVHQESTGGLGKQGKMSTHRVGNKHK